MRQSIFLKLFIGLAGMAAIGGAVVWGFAQSKEVRGDSDVLDAGLEAAVGESVARVEGVTETGVPAHEETEGWQAYLLGLEAEDYATYTHPMHGFSFSYPKEFELLSASWEDADVIDLHHPTLPLGMRVSVYPFVPHSELVADLAGIPDEYELEAPEGAQSWAVGWIDQDVSTPGQHRSVYWFRANDRLFEIQMEAPDVEWLDPWMREAAYTNLTLTPPAQES